MMNKIYKFLLYLTNNEEVSRHEKEFDVFTFLLIIICLTIGITSFMSGQDKYGWICMLIIETMWAVDGIRHNRE